MATYQYISVYQDVDNEPCPAAEDLAQQIAGGVMRDIIAALGWAGKTAVHEHTSMCPDLYESVVAVYKAGYEAGRYDELIVHSDRARATAGRVLSAALNNVPGETEEQMKMRLLKANAGVE